MPIHQRGSIGRVHIKTASQQVFMRARPAVIAMPYPESGTPLGLVAI